MRLTSNQIVIGVMAVLALGCLGVIGFEAWDRMTPQAPPAARAVEMATEKDEPVPAANAPEPAQRPKRSSGERMNG